MAGTAVSTSEVTGPETLRIRTVVEETGISKELVHHYLRQGLLPRSQSRARYTEQQVRLLRQIRTLRDDHNLPLPVIRRLFTLFEFDPARIESLTLSESLCKRITQFTSDGDLLAPQTLSAFELASTAGVTGERVTEYVRARVVSPHVEDGEQRFSNYDANVIALCERGVELGIPFESFRTTASYIRIAFDLEHEEFYGITRDSALDSGSVLASLFVRREVSASFVQNVLYALMQLRMTELLELTPLRTETLDDVVFRPSSAFVRRHGIARDVEQAREALRQSPDEPGSWRSAASLLRHAGRYDEAVFLLEKSLERWPDNSVLRGACGCVLILAGDSERGCAELERVATGGESDPSASVFLALALFKRACADQRPESLIRDAVPILNHIEAALTAVATRGDDAGLRAEVTMFCGWLLTALPNIFRCYDRGIRLLAKTVHQLDRQSSAPSGESLPGEHERHRINAAYLTFDGLIRSPTPAAGATAQPPEPTPSRDELRGLICRLDPSSAFAESVFLAKTDGSHRRRQTR